jgi:hypothetical protein
MRDDHGLNMNCSQNITDAEFSQILCVSFKSVWKLPVYFWMIGGLNYNNFWSTSIWKPKVRVCKCKEILNWCLNLGVQESYRIGDQHWPQNNPYFRLLLVDLFSCLHQQWSGPILCLESKVGETLQGEQPWATSLLFCKLVANTKSQQ